MQQEVTVTMSLCVVLLSLCFLFDVLFAVKDGTAPVPFMYDIFPIGSVEPSGWLKTQLQIQGDGLSGHLALFWPDVANSSWIGGPDDGGLHERAPYCLVPFPFFPFPFPFP